MRTTLTIDSDVAQTLKDLAHSTKRSFKAVVNEALRAGLAATNAMPQPRSYRLTPVHMGPPKADVNLDASLRIADSLEEEAIARKLELRK